jgi:glycine cleavage system H protein
MVTGSSGASPAGAPTCAIGRDLWFRALEDGSYRIGLTRDASGRAGRITHYRGPETGRFYRGGESALTIESEKWVGHLAFPVDGTVVEINAQLEADVDLVNRDPEGYGWLFRIRPARDRSLEALAGAAPGAER